MFGSKSNNNLQFGILLNNEAIELLESLIQIFGMASTFFFKFW